jgi:ABC-type uncharacterized transport system auxiliary subunit
MRRQLLRLRFLLLAVALLLAGCLGGNRVQTPVACYTLEYPPPSFPGAAPAGIALKVERLATTGDCAGWGLVRRPAPYRVGSYDRCRWAGSVSELVTDLLYRDASSSGLFQRVISPRGVEATPLIVGGEVEEFWEAAEDGGPVAVVGLLITFEDRRQDDPVRRVILQKRYRETEPMPASTPADLAAALSRAMERLSQRLLGDLHGAVARLPG